MTSRGMRALGTVVALLILVTGSLLSASAGSTPAAGADMRALSGMRSGRASAGQAAVTASGFQSEFPRLTAAQRLWLAEELNEGKTESESETPEDPDAYLRGSAPQVPSTRVPETGYAAKPRLPGDFMLSHSTDLGASKAALVAEPTVARWGSLVLEAWNWNAAVSTNGGSTFSYINPRKKFPPKWGGFCCDQVVYYSPSRGIFVWGLLYNEDSNGNNGVRLAVTDAAGLAAGTFWYWDLTPKQLGLKSGINYDQPDITGSNNFLYLEVEEFNANKGDRYNHWSDVLRFDLDDLAAKAGLPYYYYSTPLFGPGMTSGAKTTLYFAAHVDNDTLRVFSWPESAFPSGVTYVDVDHSAYPKNYPYRCPTLFAPKANWCGRADDRITNGWVGSGVIGFHWNASQGSGGLGVFPYPYDHIVRLNETTKALLSQPVIWNPDFAWAYGAVSPNARGDLGGSILYGGGLYYESCAVLLWDWNSGGFWEIPYGVSSDSVPNLPLGGDYLSSYPNAGNSNTWSASCYVLQGGGDNRDVHPIYLSFGRAGDAPA